MLQYATVSLEIRRRQFWAQLNAALVEKYSKHGKHNLTTRQAQKFESTV